jgi:hypothetical protein
MSAVSGGAAMSSSQKKWIIFFTILSILLFIWYRYKKETCEECKANY